MASKVWKRLVRLGFVNGEDESNENEGFVLRRIREERGDFGNFLNGKVTRAKGGHPPSYTKRGSRVGGSWEALHSKHETTAGQQARSFNAVLVKRTVATHDVPRTGRSWKQWNAKSCGRSLKAPTVAPTCDVRYHEQKLGGQMYALVFLRAD